MDFRVGTSDCQAPNRKSGLPNLPCKFVATLSAAQTRKPNFISDVSVQSRIDMIDGHDDRAEALSHCRERYSALDNDTRGFDWELFSYTTRYDLQAPRSMTMDVRFCDEDTWVETDMMGRVCFYGEHFRGKNSPLELYGPVDGAIIVLNRRRFDKYDRDVMLATLRHELAHCEQMHRYGRTSESDEQFKSLCKRLNAPHESFHDSIRDCVSETNTEAHEAFSDDVTDY
jgi:hypothetical protein